jgi:replicative DNA helicase
MSTDFEEGVFIWSLITRPEDAKKFSQVFKPEWLNKIEYRPVLAEIYAFVRKKGESPSLVTLNKIFEDKDAEAYKLRYSGILKELEEVNPDRSNMIFTLGQAKNVAIVRSFIEMTNDQGFLNQQENYDGDTMLKSIHAWGNKFLDSSEDRTMDIKTAIEHLVQSTGFIKDNTRIPCGIDCLDTWTGGGLRKKQLGIIMSPTGHGKTSILIIMGHKIATIEHKKVWIITNELPIEEVTERLLSRMTGVSMDSIMEDPIIAYNGLDRHWQSGLDTRLRITECNREISTDDIESEMSKCIALYGWKPDVIMLDFMERMKPSLTGYGRDKEWQWMGAIAKDLARFVKRYDMLVWTAAQTNREGYNAIDLNMAMAQGSVRHFQEATAVIGMNQVPIPGKDAVAMKFVPLKMRQSKRSPKAITVECDLAKMNITNTTIDIEELQVEEQPEEKKDEVYLSTPRERQVKQQKYKK